MNILFNPISKLWEVLKQLHSNHTYIEALQELHEDLRSRMKVGYKLSNETNSWLQRDVAFHLPSSKLCGGGTGELQEPCLWHRYPNR